MRIFDMGDNDPFEYPILLGLTVVIYRLLSLIINIIYTPLIG